MFFDRACLLVRVAVTLTFLARRAPVGGRAQLFKRQRPSRATAGAGASVEKPGSLDSLDPLRRFEHFPELGRELDDALGHLAGNRTAPACDARGSWRNGFPNSPRGGESPRAPPRWHVVEAALVCAGCTAPLNPAPCSRHAAAAPKPARRLSDDTFFRLSTDSLTRPGKGTTQRRPEGERAFHGGDLRASRASWTSPPYERERRCVYVSSSTRVTREHAEKALEIAAVEGAFRLPVDVESFPGSPSANRSTRTK